MADVRCFHMQRLRVMPVNITKVFIFPRMFAVHKMPPEAGLPAPQGKPGEGEKRVLMPAIMHLSLAHMTSDGLYLLEDGMEIFIWVGRACPPTLTQQLFGHESLE